VGDDTLGGGGRRVADGAGRPMPVSTAAFFLAAGVDGVSKREQQTAFFLAAGVDGTGEREQRTSRAGVAEVADVSGMSRVGGSSGRGSDAAVAASGGWTGSMATDPFPHARSGQHRHTDRTAQTLGSRSDPLPLGSLMDRRRGPIGSLFWAGSLNRWAEPNHPHFEVSTSHPSCSGMVDSWLAMLFVG
jgi:hypothetical protein